jgi:hypothetical protein
MMADNYSERDEDVAQARGISVWQVEQLQLTRGLSNQVIRELPEAVLRRSIQRLEYPDSPRARAAFRLATQKNEAGAIPADALSNALSQLSKEARQNKLASPLGHGL